jgi:cyclic pyranopterin phosphate synthase
MRVKVNASTLMFLSRQQLQAIVSKSSPFSKEKIALIDNFSRTISYLRLSLTDRCNLRCIYCMPDQDDENGICHRKNGEILPHVDLLSYEELLRVVRVAVSLGMNKLRLTGGEPLVRKGILQFIDRLREIEGLDEVRLTTNGVLLSEYAQHLHDSGIRQLNISLDSLQRQKFARITGRDLFDQVWRGIRTACDLGFRIKINIVAMKGINDDEFRDFINLALNEALQIRFIEFMPVGEKSSWQRDQFIRAEDIQKGLADMGEFIPYQKGKFDGPARMYRLHAADGRQGSVGFISPISHHFCDQCNRLRLTAEGKLRSCLLNDTERDIKALLRQGATDDQLMTVIRDTVLDKPKGHRLQERMESGELMNCPGQMSRIGG